MKRILLIICVIGGATITSMAQDFNPVKVGFGFGYASAEEEEGTWGRDRKLTSS